MNFELFYLKDMRTNRLGHADLSVHHLPRCVSWKLPIAIL